MQILFLNSIGRKKWGGGEKWMLMAAKGLQDTGHSVIVGCAKNSIIQNNAKALNIHTENISFTSDIDFIGFIRLKKVIKKYNISHIICGQNKDTKISSIAALNKEIKVIARHGLQLISNKIKYKIFFKRLIDGIITNSTTIKDEYETYNWFPQNFIKVIYNGVEIPDLSTIDKIDFHALLGIPKNTKTILSAGRLAKQKGFDTLIKAANLAKEHNKNWHFIVIGRGKLERKLKAEVSKLNLETKISFLGFQQNVLSFMKTADIFVLPSLYEGMPNAVLEAMSIGKCCITTNVNGNKELINNNVDGILIEPNNPQELFKTINTVFDNNELKSIIEQNALEKISKNFTINKMIKLTEDYLLSL